MHAVHIFLENLSRGIETAVRFFDTADEKFHVHVGVRSILALLLALNAVLDNAATLTFWKNLHCYLTSVVVLVHCVPFYHFVAE